MVSSTVRYAFSLVAGILIFLLIYQLGRDKDETTGEVLDLFGPYGQAQKDGAGYYVDRRHLEGRFGDASWNETPTTALDLLHFDPGKTLAPTDPGGGGSWLLPATSTPLEVRIRDAERLGEFTAKWGVYERQVEFDAMQLRRAQGEADYQAGCVFPDVKEPVVQPATRALKVNLTRPGAAVVTVELYKGTRRAAALCSPLEAAVKGGWTVTSKIRPSSFVPDQKPEDSGDEFTFLAGVTSFHGGGDPVQFVVDASTEYDGDHLPGASQQIDLEVRQRDENGQQCDGRRGSADPVQGEGPAVNRLDPYLSHGTVTVRVGRGTQCEALAPSPAYLNADAVPYRLHLRVGEKREEPAPA